MSKQGPTHIVHQNDDYAVTPVTNYRLRELLAAERRLESLETLLSEVRAAKSWDDVNFALAAADCPKEQP